jgi:hypothetical protein
VKSNCYLSPVCPSVWYNLAPTERNLIFGHFLNKCQVNSSFFQI